MSGFVRVSAINHLPFPIYYSPVDQSKRQFLADTEDLIEQILSDLDKLREQAGDEMPQVELVDSLFRRIHRIKGSAASFGYDGLSQIAHEFESLLSAVRTGRAAIGPELLDTCESAAGALAESLQNPSSGAFERSRRTLFARMQAHARKTTGSPASNIAAIPGIPHEVRQSLTDDEKRRLVQVVENGASLFVVTASFDIADFDDQFRKLKQSLEQLGEVITTSPAVNERAGAIDFRVLFAGKADPSDVTANLSDFAAVRLSQLAGGNIVRPPEAEGQEGLIVGRAAPTLPNVIRMEADELDHLISSTHELFHTTTRAIGLALSEKEISGQVREELNRWDEQIRRSFLNIEKDLIDLRVVSVGPILRRAARAGRAAARLSSKKIDFRIVGEDLRLDALLCEAVADPLIHLVRNAVDHGIEPPDQAVASGGSKQPLIRIEAAREGRRTLLRVSDNGRGVDPNVVSQAAIRLGIIDRHTRVDMERSLRMIFRPGFTTLSSASPVSGRGFGLDVVENAVEQAGGELRISSAPGKGSTFEIRLPVTVGLLNSTVVNSGGNSYCIDAEQIIKTEILDANEIQTSDAGETVKIGEEDLPVVHLRALLGQSRNGLTGVAPLHMVVCELSEEIVGAGGDRNQRVGLIVDAVRGTEEVLVRNLGRHAPRWIGIAGAAELRDGTVALVLDLPMLVRGTDFSL